jgi:hypothetical protein
MSWASYYFFLSAHQLYASFPAFQNISANYQLLSSPKPQWNYCFRSLAYLSTFTLRTASQTLYPLCTCHTLCTTHLKKANRNWNGKPLGPDSWRAARQTDRRSGFLSANTWFSGKPVIIPCIPRARVQSLFTAARVARNTYWITEQ